MLPFCLVTILHQSCHSVQNNVVILSHNNVAILFMTTLPPLLVFYCHSPDIVSCKHIYRPPPSHTMNMCCFKFKCNEIRDDLQWPYSIHVWRMICQQNRPHILPTCGKSVHEIENPSVSWYQQGLRTLLGTKIFKKSVQKRL